MLLFTVTVVPWLQSADSKRCHRRWLHFHFWVASEKTQYLRDTQKKADAKWLPLWVNGDTAAITMQSLQTRLYQEPARTSFQHHHTGCENSPHGLPAPPPSPQHSRSHRDYGHLAQKILDLYRLLPDQNKTENWKTKSNAWFLTRNPCTTGETWTQPGY